MTYCTKKSSDNHESQHAQLDTPLNIDQYLEAVNPLLMQFLPSATRTVRERQHSRMGCNEHSTSNHVKSMTELYFMLDTILNKPQTANCHT